MPSPTSGFFGGLAQGIFGRMREHEDEQRKQDLEQKRQTLSYLTSLMDQTTPETRPILFQQISNVMGLKGKQRGVWDMLTGKGRQNYSDALGQKLSEITGSIVGPKAYEQLKSHPEFDLSQIPGGGGPAWMGAEIGLTPDQTAGKIALRDPQAEDLAQLEARYALMGQQKYKDLAEKERLLFERQSALQEDRQKHDFDKATHAATLKAEGDVRKRAVALAGGPGMPITDDIWNQAAEGVAQEYGMKADLLKARIGLAGAQTEKAKAEAIAAGSIDPITGLASDDPLAGMKPGERIRFDQQQQQNAQAKFKEWSDAKARVNSAYSEVQALRKEIVNKASMFGAKFDENKGEFVGANGQPVPSLNLLAAKELAALRKLKGDQAAAEGQVKSAYELLQSQYGNYFNFGKDMWSVSPRAEFGGVATTGAPRTQPPPFPETSTTPSFGLPKAPSTNVGEEVYILLPQVPKATEPLKMWGQTYQVLGVEGKVGTYNKVRVKRIK